jgi:hypothetical protein
MAKKNNKKVPSAATKGSPATKKWKEPTLDAVEAVDGRLPLSWRFGHSDKGGPYSWLVLGAPEIHALMLRLPEFEFMTWDQLQAAGCHQISSSELCDEAKTRLRELEYDDIDELMAYRITGAKRMWCMKDGSLMRVLWWDPDHQVYPTEVDRADRIKRKRRSR